MRALRRDPQPGNPPKCATLPTQVLYALAITLTVLPLGACSYAFGIAVIQQPDQGLYFVLSRTPPPKAVDLNQFMVVRRASGSWDYKHPAWSFALPPGSYRKVQQIVYGVVPPHFLEDVKPEPLSPSIEYLAVGFGAGSVGEVEFVVER